MTFILIGIIYVLMLAFFVRFFQRVHQWDEEIRSMQTGGEVRAEQATRPKAA